MSLRSEREHNIILLYNTRVYQSGEWKMVLLEKKKNEINVIFHWRRIHFDQSAFSRR